MKKNTVILTIYICISILIAACFFFAYFKDKTYLIIPKVEYETSSDRYVTDKIKLYEGDYNIVLEYNADTDTYMSLFLDKANLSYGALLTKTEKKYEFPLHIDTEAESIWFSYEAGNAQEFVLEKIGIESSRPLFTDLIYIAALVSIGSLYLFLFFTSKYYHEKEKTEKILLIMIHVAVIIVSIPLFSFDLFWGDDVPAHVMRMEGVKSGLLDGQCPVFIFPDNNNGFGHLGFMYPNLFLYFPALLRICGVSIPVVFNSIYFIFNAATAFTSFLSGEVIFKGNRYQKYVFTILYVLLPYRLVNLYNRADLPELIAMCFLPLVISGVYSCICEDDPNDFLKPVAMLVIGMTGIFHSHIPSSVDALALALLYALIFLKHVMNKRSIGIIVTSIVCTFLINIGFIVPFIRMYTFGLNLDYYRRTYGITIYGRYALMDLLGIHDFSHGTAWGGISLIGIAGAVLFLYYVISVKKDGSKSDTFMTATGIIFLVLFMSVPSEFPWNKIVDTGIVKLYISVMEYSFRIMFLAAPLLSLITVYALFRINIGSAGRKAAAAALFLLALICAIPGVMGELKEEAYIHRLSNDAGNSHLREYWPQGTTDSIFDDDRVYWSSENLEYDGYVKKGTNVEFQYDVLTDKDEWIEPPVLYYPGYKAIVIDASGKKYDLAVTQGDYFRTKIELPAVLSGSSVKMYYGGLWYFNIAYFISVVSTFVFAAVLLANILYGKRKKACVLMR